MEKSFHSYSHNMDMRYELNRLNSLKNWPISFIEPKDCAAVGLYFQGSGGLTCAFCKVNLSEWEKGDRPLVKHLEFSPMCPYLLHQDVGNVPISGTNGTQKWETENAKPERRRSMEFDYEYPSMNTFDKRFRTFATWTSLNQCPAKLTEAGLFYLGGTTDTVVCFCCGIQICNWGIKDDPWIEHAKHSLRCKFAKSIKGSVFMEQASVKLQSSICLYHSPTV